MKRINQCFETLKQNQQKGLIIYLMAGDPDLNTSLKLVETLVESKVDIIELGIPFSDPIADGEVIQRAGTRALKQKVNLSAIFSLITTIRQEKKIEIPILLMGYYNPILQYGLKQFAEDGEKAGIDGVIIPDLTPEEGGEFYPLCENHNIAPIILLAPTSTEKRIKIGVQQARGFIYYVSRTGITGMQNTIAEDLAPMVKKIKGYTNLPIAVGFGISNAEQAKQVAQVADAVVIGSAVVKIIEKKGSEKELYKAIKEYLNPIVETIHNLKN